MKASNNLTTAATLNGYNYQSNGLSIVVLNNRDLYCQLEHLCEQVRKIARKAGGVDMNIIYNCSTLKAITRNARRHCLEYYEEIWTMKDDAQARTHLTYYVAEYALLEE